MGITGGGDYTRSGGSVGGGTGYISRLPLTPPVISPPVVSTPTTAPGISATTGITPEDVGKLVNGRPIPVSLGGPRLMGGNLVVGPYWEKRIRNGVAVDVVSGGWLFSQVVTPVGVRVALQIRLRGFVAYDLATGINAMPCKAWRFAGGAEDQLPDPLLIAQVGEANASAFRGYAMLWIEELEVSQFVGEDGAPFIPFVSVLFADNVIVDPANFTFNTPTSTPVVSYGAVDWDSGILYAVYGLRLLSYDLPNQLMIADIPITNLSLDYSTLFPEHLLYIDALGLLLGVGWDFSPIREHLILLDPLSGQIVAESVLPIVSTLDDPGPMTFSVDLTGSEPVYVFPMVTAALGILRVYRYDPQTDAETLTLVEETTDDLDGLTPAGGRWLIVRAPNDADGHTVFYIGAGTSLVKLVVDLFNTAAPFTLTIVYTAASAINMLHFDESDGGLSLFLDNGTALKLSLDTYLEIWINTAPGFTVNPGVTMQIRTTEGWRRTRPLFAYIKIHATEPDGVFLLNLTNGGVSFYAVALADAGHTVFDSATAIIYQTDVSDDLRSLSLAGDYSGRILISQAVELLAEFPPDEEPLSIQTSGITDSWDCVIFSEDLSWQNFIQALCRLYPFFTREIDGELWLIQRALDGGLVIDTTVERAVMFGGDQAPITVSFGEPQQTQKTLELLYVSKDDDFQQKNLRADREEDPRGSSEQIRLPVVMQDDEAMSLIYGATYREDAAREQVTFPLTLRHIGVEPGDVLSVVAPFNGYTKTFTVAVDRITDGANWRKDVISRVLLRQAILYVPGLIPVQPSSTSAAQEFPNSLGGLPIELFLNIPLLNRAHEVSDGYLRWYYATASAGAGGYFGVYVQPTGGLQGASEGVAVGSYVGRATNGTPLTGTLIGDLPAPPFEGLTDYTNTITFVPRAGDVQQLQDLTYDQMMNGEQIFAVGVPGRWELIQAQEYSVNVDGTYELSILSRGYNGTERYSGTHEAGDAVVLLKEFSSQMNFVGTSADRGGIYSSGATVTIAREQFFESTLDDTVNYVSWNFGTGAAEALSQPIKSALMNGAADRMPPPVNLAGVVSGGSTILTWHGRTRFPWMFDDGTFEQSDPLLFDIDAYAGASIVESWTDIAVETVTRSAVDVTSFVVYPKNDLGRGFSATKTL